MHRLLKLGPLLCLLLPANGCFESEDRALFDGGTTTAAGAAGQAASGSSNAESGTSSGSSAGAAVEGGGGSTAGAGSSPPGGNGSAGSAAGFSGVGSQAGQGGQGAPVIVIDDCAVLDQAVASPAGDRCYRVNHQNLSFADARSSCRATGGYLVSIGSQSENELVAELHDGEHWLGATDGRSDTTPGAGPYIWDNGEEWRYSKWEDGQPNAYEVDCPGDDEADCFEHCAFQSDEGDWNDRSCWHTLVSICEWDLARPGAGGAGGGAEP